MNALVTTLAGVILAAGGFNAAHTPNDGVPQRNTTYPGSKDTSTLTPSNQWGYWELADEALVSPRRGVNNQARTLNLIDALPGFHPLRKLLPLTTSEQRRLLTLTDSGRPPKTRHRRNLAHVIRKMVPSRAIKQSHRLKAEQGRVHKGYGGSGPRPAGYQGRHSNGSNNSRFAVTRRTDETNKDYVYYETERGDLRNSVIEHLAIVEVPKGASGVIPLKNVHIIAPGPQGQVNRGLSLIPSAKAPLDIVPYVIAKKSDSGSERPLLVLPFAHEHAKRHGPTDAILPLQKAPPIIRGVKESFNELRGVNSRTQPHSAQPESRNIFGPPKGEDVVTMQNSELGGAKRPPNQRPNFSSYYSESLSHRPSPAGAGYYDARHIPQRGTGAMVIKGMAPPGQPSNLIRRPHVNYNADFQRPNENTPPEIRNNKYWPNLGSGTRTHKWFKHTPNHVYGPMLRTPDVQLVYTQNHLYHSPPKGTRNSATSSRGGGIVTNLQKQISKGIRNFPVWIDGILGAESSPPKQYAQTQSLNHPHYIRYGQRPRVKAHQERPQFHVSGSPSNKFHPNENSLFFNRFPTSQNDGAVNSQHHRGASVQRLTPVSIAKTKINSAATPNAFIREGPKVAPYTIINGPSIQLNTKGVPRPSHRGSPAVNSLNFQGGHKIASSQKFQLPITIKHRDRDIPPQTNPTREDRSEEVEEYVGPPLVMFTLDDAISLESTRSVGLTHNKKPQQEDSFVPVANGFYPTQSRQPIEQEKYYVVEIRGKPSAEREKNLISSSERTKNGLPSYKGSIASSEDKSYQTYHFNLSTEAPIPTQTEPATYFRLPTAPIPPTVTEPSNGTRNPGKPKLDSLFRFNKPKINSDNFSHSSYLQPEWKTPDRQNIDGTKTSLSVSVNNKATDRDDEKTKVVEVSNLSSPSSQSSYRESTNQTDLEQNRHTNKANASVDSLAGISKLKPIFRRVNLTNWHITRGNKPLFVTSGKNQSKWFEGFKRQNENKKEKGIEYKQQKPFGFQLWHRSKTETNATSSSKEAKLRPAHLSQVFVKNFGSKNEEDSLLMSSSKKYPVQVQIINGDKAIGGKQIPAKFIYKWPKYIRPPLSANNGPEFETIKSLANDSTQRNSNNATFQPRNQERNDSIVDGNDCIEENSPSPMVPQEKQIQVHSLETKKTTSPFLKFQKLVETKKAEREAKDRNKERVLWKSVKDTSESTSTTESSNLHTLTIQATNSTTFKINTDGSSSRSRPLRFLSMLRNRAKNRRELEKTTMIARERGNSTRPTHKYLGRKLQRRRRPQRSSAARLRLSTTTIWPEIMKEQTTDKSKLNEQTEVMENNEKDDKEWSSGERLAFSWGRRDEMPGQDLQQISRPPDSSLSQNTYFFSEEGTFRPGRKKTGDLSHKSSSQSIRQSPTYTTLKIVSKA